MRRLRKCVEKANAARTAIVEDSPEVDLRTCIEASEAISEFVDGKGMLKDEVLKILLAALDEVSNISPEIQEDFEMEIEDLTNAFERAKKLIEEMGEAYQAPDHLQLAREIVKPPKPDGKPLNTSYLQDLLRNCQSSKRTRLQHDGCLSHQSSRTEGPSQRN